MSTCLLSAAPCAQGRVGDAVQNQQPTVLVAQQRGRAWKRREAFWATALILGTCWLDVSLGTVSGSSRAFPASLQVHRLKNEETGGAGSCWEQTRPGSTCSSPGQGRSLCAKQVLFCVWGWELHVASLRAEGTRKKFFMHLLSVCVWQMR